MAGESSEEPDKEALPFLFLLLVVGVQVEVNRRRGLTPLPRFSNAMMLHVGLFAMGN